MLKLLIANQKPISLIILTTIIGYFFGDSLAGFLVGLGIVAATTLFFR